MRGSNWNSHDISTTNQAYNVIYIIPKNENMTHKNLTNMGSPCSVWPTKNIEAAWLQQN